MAVFAVSTNKIPRQTQEGTLPPAGDSARALFWDFENVTPSKVTVSDLQQKVVKKVTLNHLADIFCSSKVL